ncbi:class I SAM-dependent methyltransferase [Haloechinothrix halophila]|uniref:class I SAM-dependent methyltransferase n=1 Tax=Haloechinothrix halophila TaxID=1069073 RepID=UPI00040AAF6C|nr:class I SAM-dependent methyltransferase [Haloechinothrix halophila]
MTRWTDMTGAARGAEYASRFAELEAKGTDVHGEAQLCASLVPAGAWVLDAGCGTGRVAQWLHRNGYECVGVDLDEEMLAEARRAAPEIRWIQADLAALDLAGLGLAGAVDLVVCAGNVIPLVAAGTEATVVTSLAGALRPGGLLVAGFGLDAAHLPLDEATVTLADYDAWCADAGLSLRQRFATWDGDPYDGGGYAVSVHRR